ncbi:MAG: exopolysaccharide biosynthesis protein [Prochlorothrix sp.]
MAKLSTDLHRFFFEDDRNATVSLGEILTLAGERAFGVLFVLVAFPSALPVPAPGYSIPFGLLIMLLAGQLVVGRDRPWFPASWLRWTVPLEMTQKVMQTGLPWLSRLEALTRPRLSFLCTSPPGRLVVGLALALMGLSMMIPIPGTNTLPAMGVFVTGFSFLEDDGAITLGGLTLCLMGFLLSTGILVAIFFLGVEGAQAAETVKEWIRSLF